MNENGENKVIEVQFGDKPCQITPLDSPISPSMMPGYFTLCDFERHREQISAMVHEIPSLMAANIMSKAYILHWPEGLAGEWMSSDAGLRPILRDPATKKMVAIPTMDAVKTQAVILGGFTAMSMASGQYFLAQINRKMSLMSKSIDDILGFLYGEKRAELLAEVSFAKYAQDNFATLMLHEPQRVATIQSLQEGRKTAIKDIEFYLGDLHSTTNDEQPKNAEESVDKAFKIHQSLDLAMQLYITDMLLEVYYAQNMDKNYLSYVEKEASDYISKCDHMVLADFYALKNLAVNSKPKFKKGNGTQELVKRVDDVLQGMKEDRVVTTKQRIHNALYSWNKALDCIVTEDGTMFLKKE